MDTYHQDLATATEVLNKAYQLKQVDKKWYWPLKSDIDRSGCVTSSRAHHSSMVNRWRVKSNMLVCQGVGGIVADIDNYFRHGNVNWLYIGVSVIFSLASIITIDIAM